MVDLPVFWDLKIVFLNGRFNYDQQNQATQVTPTNNTYVADQWRYIATQTGKITTQKTPSQTETGYASRLALGLSNYLNVTSLSAYSVLTSDYFGLQQPVEGVNVADLAWGTSSAQSVTIQFVFLSSITGTISGSVQNSAGNRSYPFSFTVSAANTYNTYSVTIPGDTAGTWLNTEATVGLYLTICLGAGSTYLGTAGIWTSNNYYGATGTTSIVGTSGAVFDLAFAQLEKGSTATSFDIVPAYAESVQVKRHFTLANNFIGTGNGTTSAYAFVNLAAPMMTLPAVTFTGTASLTQFGVATYTSTTQPSGIGGIGQDPTTIVFQQNGFAGSPAATTGTCQLAVPSGYYLSARLT